MCIRPALFIALVVLGLALRPLPAGASFIESVGIGSRATSLGGAFIGVADDISAFYYNPAGLTQLIGGYSMDSAVGLRMVHLSQSIREPIVDETSKVFPNQKYKYSDHAPNVAFEPYAPFGFEIGDRIYLAPLPIISPFQGFVQFNENIGDARFSSADVGTFFITASPSIGFKVTPWLSVGAGFDLILLSDVWQKAIIGDGAVGRAAAKLVTGNPNSPIEKLVTTEDGKDDAFLQITPDQRFPTGLKPINDADVDLEHYGFHVGVMLFPTEFIRLGVMYRSRLDTENEGRADVSFAPEILNNPIYRLFGVHNDHERFHFGLPMPQIVGVGGSVKITDQWMWAIDGTWVNWSIRDKDDIYFGGNGLSDTRLSSGYKHLVIPRDWRDVYSVRTGVEYKPVEHLALTAGFWYDPSPTPDSTWTPHDDPGAGKLAYSGGIAYNGLYDGTVDIQLHFQYIDMITRTINVGQDQNLGGAREQSLPDKNGLLNPAFVPNETFSMNQGGAIINGGLTITFHM